MTIDEIKKLIADAYKAYYGQNYDATGDMNKMLDNLDSILSYDSPNFC